MFIKKKGAPTRGRPRLIHLTVYNWAQGGVPLNMVHEFAVESLHSLELPAGPVGSKQSPRELVGLHSWLATARNRNVLDRTCQGHKEHLHLAN